MRGRNNMKRIAALLSILMLLPALGCVGHPGAITADLGRKFELRVGQTVSIEGEQIMLKFVEAVNDSRCPDSATCIWQGEVTCLIEITYLGSTYTKTLTQPGLSAEPSRDIFQGYSIAFNVLPYPSLEREIKANEYRLELVIGKNADFEDNKLYLMSYGEPGNLKNVIEGTEITATFSDGHVGGSAGCNTYGGVYQITGDALAVTDVYSTLMACTTPGVMIQEQEFLALLLGARSFGVSGTTLTVYCSGGQQLNFTTAGGA